MNSLHPVGWMGLGLIVLLLSCGEGNALDRLSTVWQGGTAASTVERPGEVASAEAGAAEAVTDGEPVEIYYDLTLFDWYRHGDPLIFSERAYLPDGDPHAAENMRPAGEYGGVRFYVRPQAEEPYDSVFVPVFRNYWQPFTARADAPRHAD